MAQEKNRLDHILQLVDQLTPSERKNLIEQLTVDELGREVQIGIDAADEGDLTAAEEVFSQLKQRNASRKVDGN